MASSFAISLEDDAKNSEWYWDISTNANRTIRVSISSFPVKNDPTNLKTETWVYFKLFKLIPEVGVRKYQQVCFRSVEADRLLQSLGHMERFIMYALPREHEELNLELDRFAITDDEDAGQTHWFIDVYETAKRKTRVSYVMYKPKDPIKSTYIQLKLFKTSEFKTEFQRKGLVNYTLQEFEKLRIDSVRIRETLKLMSSQ